MKYLKKYENIQLIPQKGDYVLMKSDCGNIQISNYISNHIGQIEIKEVGAVHVKYNTKIFDSPRIFSVTQIIDFAKTKEELEIRLIANKYNI
jgi:hypothetical protein